MNLLTDAHQLLASTSALVQASKSVTASVSIFMKPHRASCCYGTSTMSDLCPSPFKLQVFPKLLDPMKHTETGKVLTANT